MLVTFAAGPQIASFSIELRVGGRLSLTMSAEVTHSSFEPTKLTLQNSATVPTESYTFTNAGPLTVSGNVVGILITQEDLAGIQLLPNLATERSNTYLSAKEGVLLALNGDPSQPIAANTALWVDTFTNDTQPPELSRFSVDIDNGEVFMFFSEPVTNVVLSRIRLQNDITDQPSADELVPLAGATKVQTKYPFSIRVALEPPQIAALKRFDMARGFYMSIGAEACEDLAGNPLMSAVTILADEPVEKMPPRVFTFTLKEESRRKLLFLNFSEPVSVFSLDPTLISIQSASDIQGDLKRQYTLTGGTPVTLVPSIVSIVLNDFDARNLTRLNDTSALGFADNANNFLSFREGMVYDLFDNPIQAVPSYAAINEQGQVPGSSSMHSEVCKMVLLALLGLAILLMI